MTVTLVGNYPPDKQESMERFTQLLYRGFVAAGVTTQIWHPKVFFGKFSKNSAGGLGKWLGYIDKWILFPVILRYRTFKNHKKTTNNFFHICDHSNAPYLSHLPSQHTSITCHDVIAIRGALGYKDAYCNASGFGKILQKWILANLVRAKKIAPISNLTNGQLAQLTPSDTKISSLRKVIHLAFNGNFARMEAARATSILKEAGIEINEPFILHVGSSLPRKNRKLLLDMVHELGEKWQGKICYAGQGMDLLLSEHAIKLGLQNRVIEVKKPGEELLLALYSTCDALIFPSYSEGFGWPVIEAQACGAPVIASSIEPMPEISGGAAIHIAPDDSLSFANALLSLQNTSTKTELIKAGFNNIRRFEQNIMIQAYIDFLSRPFQTNN